VADAVAASRRATAGAEETIASAASEASTADWALAASSSAVGRAGAGRAVEEEAVAGVGAAAAGVEVEGAAEAPVRLTNPPVAWPGLAVKGDCQKGTVAPVGLATPPPPYGGIGAGGEMTLRAPVVGAVEEGVALAREVEAAALEAEAEGVPPGAGVDADDLLAGVAAPARAPIAAAGALLVIAEAPG
jgi:hypothetical protein